MLNWTEASGAGTQIEGSEECEKPPSPRRQLPVLSAGVGALPPRRRGIPAQAPFIWGATVPQ
ncbi:MAG: hypothetical protein KME26_05765 [Oscillatoria princeps RMCB-10]|nr:hypothetical protein [Oscillatoria princeps RMCB-10]